MDLQTRLRKLEESISHIEYQQDNCRPFIKLASDSTSLNEVKELFNSFEAQVAELNKEYEAQQNAVTEVSERVEESKAEIQALVAEELIKKQDVMQKIEVKISQIEQDLTNVLRENPVTLEEVEEKLQGEIDAIVAEALEKLQGQKQAFVDRMGKTGKVIFQTVAEVEKTQKGCSATLEEFEIKYHQFVDNPGDPDGDKKNAILKQAIDRINEFIDECKLEMDGKFRSLTTKYTFEMEYLQKQLEEMLKAVTLTKWLSSSPDLLSGSDSLFRD